MTKLFYHAKYFKVRRDERVEYNKSVRRLRKVKKEHKVKARKVRSSRVSPRKRRSGSSLKAGLLLEEIIEDNLEAFKLLTRY